MEECDELHGAVRSQARVVPRGVQMARVWGYGTRRCFPYGGRR
jgi:hypothetical protein